jgi:5-methylcytosine-specific restriction endonuclease McrA
MYFLGTDYVVSSIIWLTLVGTFVFAFRKKIFKRFYEDEPFDEFIYQLKLYLEKNYPKLKYDLSIIEVSESEPNPLTRKLMIISDILNQFNNLKIDKSKLPNITPPELHQWDSYVFHCEPHKQKLPPDWAKRKNALLTRDQRKCFRCTKAVDINSVDIHMLRSLNDGGKYYLENLIPVCRDCKKVLENDPKSSKSLNIKDDLEDLVEKY